jgi:hypothetical protein
LIRRLTICGRWPEVAWFLTLAFLCYEGHQWFRHLVGMALCSGIGTMTFTVATMRPPCAAPTFIGLSGPLFTFGLEWLGMLLLFSRRAARFGYALVFASFAHLRFIQTLTGRGDELELARQWFASPSIALVAVVVFFIGLPPVIAAFGGLEVRRRTLIFASSYLLPLPMLFAILIASRLLYGEAGNAVTGATLLGVPIPVLIVQSLAIGLFIYSTSREKDPRDML